MELAVGLAQGADGLPRCWWAHGDAAYEAYHDREWGRPVTDDRRLFEKLCLEGFQSGLSWLTILRKRENFRRAFAGFDPAAVARFGEADIQRLWGQSGSPAMDLLLRRAQEAIAAEDLDAGDSGT